MMADPRLSTDHSEGTSRRRGPLITVLGGDDDEENAHKSAEEVDAEEDEEEEEEAESPPCLTESSGRVHGIHPAFIVANDMKKDDAFAPSVSISATDRNDSKGSSADSPPLPSLMECLMEDAGREKVRSDEVKIKKEREGASDTFKTQKKGKGIKKGFLLAEKKKKKKKPSSSSSSKEISSDPPPGIATASKTKIPTLRSKNDRGEDATKSPLVIEEVQRNMRRQQNPLLEALERGDLVTDELMDRVRSSPHLLERLSDPRYAAALEEMRVDPGRAKKKYQDVPEMINFFRDFCGVVGDHFMQLDAAQKREQGRRSYENGDGVEIQAKSRNVGEDVAIRELGKGNFTTTPQNDADAAKVDAILQDREMAEMLMDPEMKKVMADCSRPGAMRAFMSHPKWGPKLRKMIDHGLLQVA